MTTPTITAYPGDIPAKGQSNTVFDTNVDAYLVWLSTLNIPELQALVPFLVGLRDEVAATALSGTLPTMSGKAGDFFRVNAGETAVEFRTAAEVLGDIGAVTALAAKAPLAAPTFTGVPAAPTATAGTDTTQIATTAFTKAAIAAATPDWELIYTTTTPADGTITLDTAKLFSTYRTLCFAGGNTGTGGLNRMIIPVSDFELGGVCVIFVMYNAAWRFVRVTHLTDTTFTLGSSGSGYTLGNVWGLK